MLHLRAIVPADRTEKVCEALSNNEGVTNLIVIPGAARRPPGDLVQCDLAREAANEVIDSLQALGIEDDGSIALEEVDVSLSKVAEIAEERAPGHRDDAVVWEELDQRTEDDAELTWTFVVFLALATQIAGIAALIDSPILIVGAMVLGPEFGTVAAICYSVIFRKPQRILRAVRTLAVGFSVAIAVTLVCALASRGLGLIGPDTLKEHRELTGFVYNPDRWSFIVALLAGVAGVLSLTAGKSAGLVGTFISVTTVPAAGNIAVAIPLGHWNEVTGSLLQLAVNFGGMIITGVITLIIQKTAWRYVRDRSQRRRAAA